MSTHAWRVIALMAILSLVLVACAPAPTQAPAPAPAPTQASAPAPTQAAPQAATQAPAKVHRLALIQFLKGHPVHRLMQLGFQEGCKAQGYECDMLLTDSTSAVDMIPLAEQALAQGYDGVVLYAVDDSFFPTIKKFKDEGIPVVTPHFTSFDQAASGLTAVVGADVVAYAKAAAEAMGAKLDGKGTVAVTVGSFNQTENLVAETFKATMKEKYPDIKVLDPQEEGFDAAQAIAKAVAIIQGNPDITGAFSTTGNGPTTWAQRSRRHQQGRPGDHQHGLHPAKPRPGQGRQGLWPGGPAAVRGVLHRGRAARQSLDGKAIEYRNLLPAPIITAADLDEYYAFNDRAEAGIEGESRPSRCRHEAGVDPVPEGPPGPPPDAARFPGRLQGAGV